jgi:hypothetical protein
MRPMNPLIRNSKKRVEWKGPVAFAQPQLTVSASCRKAELVSLGLLAVIRCVDPLKPPRLADVDDDCGEGRLSEFLTGLRMAQH